MRIIAVVLNRNELNTTPQEQSARVLVQDHFSYMARSGSIHRPYHYMNGKTAAAGGSCGLLGRRSKKGDSELLINAFRNPLNWTLSAAH